MKQTSDDYLREQDRLQQLVQRYENSLTPDGNLTTWFDSEDIEDICNVYVDAGDLKKANDALKVGLQMHPTDSALQMLRAHLLIEEYKPEEASILLKQLNFTKEFYWHYLCLGAYADLGIW